MCNGEKNAKPSSDSVHQLFHNTQHSGRSAGGPGSISMLELPFFTMKAMDNPQLVCISKWQCINH
eukprot:c12900_g2_i1 orf=1-192(-)